MTFAKMMYAVMHWHRSRDLSDTPLKVTFEFDRPDVLAGALASLNAETAVFPSRIIAGQPFQYMGISVEFKLRSKKSSSPPSGFGGYSSAMHD